MSTAKDFVPVAVARRSGFDESFHMGAVVVLAADGSVARSWGNPNTEVYGRSCNKPLQAAGMLDLGAELDDRQLALACASHSGLAEHLAVVRSTLSDNRLDETALQNTPALPLNSQAAHRVLASGGTESAVLQNCSGKHVAMLATCVANDWPLKNYLDVDHPLQVALTQHIARLADGVVHVGIDGCGAPTHATTLVGLARAFARLASAQGRIWQAMTTYPELVAGDERAPTQLMRAVTGLMAKDGADGVFAGGLPDGRAVAVKIGDGAGRASGPVMAAALAFAGETGSGDPGQYGDPILGHGQPVGSVVPILA